MRLAIAITAIFFIVFSSIPLRAADSTTIYIEVVGVAEFDVIYHRALTNATGALVGGLIGAGIQAGVESSKDASKVDVIEPMIDRGSWKEYFLDALNSKLESKKYTAKWVDDSAELTSGSVLKLYPGNYGFRVVDASTMLMSAYVEFEATFTNPGTKDNENGKKHFYVTSKDTRSYESFASDREVLNSDLQAALTKAAQRIANKIIYNKEV
jgi:hypothetical protein